MRDCEDVLKELFNFIDNEMDGTSAAEIKAHLDLCRPCLDRVEFEKVLRQHCREKTNHFCPGKLKDRIKKLIENF
jgi:mycothiol system anti-sigma-R factor